MPATAIMNSGSSTSHREAGAARSSSAARREPDAISMLAHDVRGPLANLALIIEAIEGQGPADAGVRRLTGRAQRVIDRLEGMVNAMLVRARFHGADVRFEPAPVALTDVVADAVELNQALAERRGVRLHAYLADPLVVAGDADLLMQAVDNLLTNAIKFTPAGGLVVCQLAHEDGNAVIRIEDDGPGLSSEDVDCLFRPMAPRPVEGTGPLGSSGIGLAIVRRIAESHGGSVAAGNGTDGGAVFTIRIPLSVPVTG